METGDRKLNEVKKVTDMAYVPVIMADGSIGQIAKSDLASVVAGVIGDANQNKSGLLSISNYKKSPIDLLMSAGKLYEIAKICKDYRSAIIEVYGVKSPSWDTNKPIQTVIIGMHTDNTAKQAIDVRKDSDMIDVYYDSSSVYIKNNYTYAIQVNIVFKQMGDKGEEFMIPTLSTKDVSELNKAREVGTVFGYDSLVDLAEGVAEQMTASKLFPFADRGDLTISANDVNQNGSYSIMGKGTTLDLPLDYGTLVSFNMGGYFAVQICTLSSAVYVRGRNNGVWSPWCKLQTL